ncbi:MAG: glycosyltransferase, partial [Ilumatobacteraceae bacterium]
GAQCVVMLWAGAVAVLGPIGELAGSDACFVPHLLQPLPDDGCAPEDRDLVTGGTCSTNVAAFGADAAVVLAWLRRQLDDGEVTGPFAVGPLLDVARGLYATRTTRSAALGAGPWRWPDDETVRVSLVDAPDYDHQRPWVLDPHAERPARIRLVGHADHLAVMAAAEAQLSGARQPLTLPGGIVVDETIRALVADEPRCPAPWSEAAAFRRWLEARYWVALHSGRRDLALAFPEPIVADRTRFDSWCASAFAVDAVPFMVRHRLAGAQRLAVAHPLRTDGLNLAGYLTRESSLGDVARRILTGLDAAGVARSTIAHQRTGSPEMADATPGDTEIRFSTTLAVVNADQFPALRDDHPELFDATQRMVGYWFWELEAVPRAMRGSIALVDEIWVGSQFVADAFAAVANVPVHRVAIPVPMPAASQLTSSDFAPLVPFGDRPIFLVAFDHFSITERKNPIGAITAFRNAFAPDEGPVLVVKSMNGSTRWAQHQKVVAAAGDRPDIVIWDEHLTRADQMALVASADCLVSLHRSEGLGLHLAEAMWLGTPTIATRYSGNLDFMDDESALLIDAGRVHVTDGQGIYPPTAMWADPDLEQAAAAMQRIVGDTKFAARLAADARAKMVMQPTLEDTGRHIAQLLHGGD